MNDEDLNYLEELAKEPEQTKLDKIVDETFSNEEDKEDYRNLIKEHNLNVVEDEEEDDLKDIDIKSLFNEEQEEEIDFFDEEKKEPVVEEENKLTEDEEFDNKFSKQKELRLELDNLYKELSKDGKAILEEEPQLLDVSDEGIEEFKKEHAEWLRQSALREKINKSQSELSTLESKNGNYSQQAFNRKFNKICEGVKSINKNFDEDFKKFIQDVTEFSNSKKDDPNFAKKSSVIDNLIMNDENAVDLFAYFTKKPDEYKKLLEMSEIEAVKILSSNSTRVSLKKESMKKNKDISVSKPLDTNVASNTKMTKVKSSKDLYNLSDDEFDKLLKDYWPKIKNY